ncbi:MAG: aldehyde dehydrogenase [Verrucomicrobiales bacterium]|nr:aldehyde dehydrogenase [Verrucomicrobiales bacterium]
MPAAPRTRLNVLKTYKLFVGGKFPRPESGRIRTASSPADGSHLAHYARASKKDLRDAVSAARGALPGWSGSTAYLRGQILYRLAEMFEGRAEAFAAELARSTQLTLAAATAEVADAIDRLVYQAGWTDKLSQVFGTVNPVAAPFFNVSTLDPAGVVVAFAPDAPSLLGAVTLIGNALAVGNTVILIASDTAPLPVMSLAEAVATSDIPGGAVNILTGQRAELAAPAAEHRDIDSIVDAAGDPALTTVLQGGSAVNLKRVTVYPRDLAWTDHDKSAGPYRLLELTETRTTWHPVGV